MKATFDDVAAVFGAERAVLLNPRAASPLNIVCNRGLKPEHLGAISRGVSTPGVSASTIQHVLQSKAPYIVEHPLLAAGSRRTASLAENYSVICAPVLDATGGLVLACYYFQNSGPNLKKAYRLHDMQLLNSICTLLTLLATQREIQDLSMRPDLTLREIRDEYTRRVVVNRLRRYPDNFGQVVESLGIQRAHLYRLLEKFDLPGAREAREARRSGEEIAAASAAVAVPDDDEDQ